MHATYACMCMQGCVEEDVRISIPSTCPGSHHDGNGNAWSHCSPNITDTAAAPDLKKIGGGGVGNLFGAKELS